MGGHLAFHGVARERTVAGQALVQHTRQCIDVGAGVGLTGRQTLGRHVVPAANRGPGTGQARLVGPSGDTEVDQVCEVVLVDQDVGRLDVAVHQTDLVGGVQRAGYLADEVHRPFWRQRALSQYLSQIATLDKSHVDV